MGLNVLYMNCFLIEIEKEVLEYIFFIIDIKFNYKDQWEGKIMIFKKQEGKFFKNELIELKYSLDVVKRVIIDM